MELRILSKKGAVDIQLKGHVSFKNKIEKK